MANHHPFESSIAPPGSSYYYALRYADPLLRPTITALIAFAEAIQAIPYECSDPALAQQKLEWWRNDIIQMKMKRAMHPISQALQAPVQTFQLPTRFFLSFIDEAESHLTPIRCENFDSLLHTLQKKPHIMPTLLHPILSRNPPPETFTSALSLSLQLAKYIFDFRKMAKAGKLVLPENELQATGISIATLDTLKEYSVLRPLFEKITQHAHALHARAIEALPKASRKIQRFALVYSALQMQRLAEIEKAGFPVMEHQIYLTPLRKLWVAWWT